MLLASKTRLAKAMLGRALDAGMPASWGRNQPLPVEDRPCNEVRL